MRSSPATAFALLAFPIGAMAATDCFEWSGEGSYPSGHSCVIVPYANLMERCEDQCCIESVKKMEAGKFKALTDGYTCPENYHAESLRCKTSYKWCAPKMDSSQKSDDKDDIESDSRVFSEAYEKANEIVSIAKRKEKVATELNNIGTYYLYGEKQYDHAGFFYERSHELFQQIGNYYGIAMTTYNQGVLMNMTKEKGGCDNTIEALPIAEKTVGNKRYNQKLSVALIATIKRYNKINCGDGT